MTVNNWGQARKAAITVLEGDFPVVITEAAAGRSADGNKDNIKVKMTITSGDYVNRKLFDTLTISPDSGGAMAMFFKAMEAFGMGDTFFATCPQGSAGVALMAANMQGKEITATLKGEVFQGINREKVKGYKPRGAAVAGGAPVPLVAAPLVLAAPVPVVTSTPPPVFGGDEATPAQSFATAATVGAVAALTAVALIEATAETPAAEEVQPTF